MAIGVIHGGRARLLAREHDELGAFASPGNVLNLVVEDWDEGPVLTLVDPDELQGVLTVVALARRVVEVLCPDKYSFARWRWQYLNILRLWTCYIEFWSLQIAVQVIDIY